MLVSTPKFQKISIFYHEKERNETFFNSDPSMCVKRVLGHETKNLSHTHAHAHAHSHTQLILATSTTARRQSSSRSWLQFCKWWACFENRSEPTTEPGLPLEIFWALQVFFTFTSIGCTLRKHVPRTLPFKFCCLPFNIACIKTSACIPSPMHRALRVCL